MKTRLGTRLTALFDAIPGGYDSVWDLCCDHGRLGTALIEARRTPEVHFVDRVPAIMSALEQRLRDFGAEGFGLHTADATDIELPGAGHHLLVLAGVGDEVTESIVGALARPGSAARFDWLLSPANNLFQVRRFLARRGFGLLGEGVVFENRRGYEWLKVTGDRNRAPAPVPNPARFWEPERGDHRAHLQKLVRHARQQLHNPRQTEARTMLAAYQSLLGAPD